MDRHRGFQFVKVRPPPIADLRRVRAMDAVADLGDGEGAENDRYFAAGLPYRLDGLFGSESPPLGNNQDAGIED